MSQVRKSFEVSRNRAGDSELRAQHRLFETLPDDMTPPVLTRLAHARAADLDRRRLKGRTSDVVQLRSALPRVAAVLGVAALVLLVSRQGVL